MGMLFRKGSGRRSRIGTTAVVSLTVTAVVVAAVTATGFPVDHVAANDGAVWVTDSADGAFGRYDYPIAELDAAFGPPGAQQPAYNLDILQAGTTVLAVDRARDSVYSVDVQSGTLSTPGVAVPGGADGRIALGGPVAAMLDTSSGKLWAAVVGAGQHASVADLDPGRSPLLKVAGASALAVGLDGSVYVASPHQLVTIRYRDAGLAAPLTTQLATTLGNNLAVTAVGPTAVIMDADHEQIVVPSTGASLRIPDASSTAPGVLQQPGPTDPAVLVASASALYSLPLTGESPATLATGAAGTPASPVVLNGCVYAAWGGAPGQYAQQCRGSAPFHAPLPGPAVVTPIFRVNNGQILLNDVATGWTWSVDGPPTVVLNAGDWKRFLAGQKPDPTKPVDNKSPSAVKRPPVAKDQDLRARSGRTSVLHILDGDSDPAGSVISIANITPAVGTGFTVHIAPDMQSVSATLDSSIVAPIHFQYTIIDAQAQSATATVTVTPTADETPPHLREGSASPVRYLASGASAAYQVLGDWRDGESDALTVSQAAAPQGQASWTGDGLVSFTAPVFDAETKVTVTYQVSDGLAAPVDGTIEVNILGRGDTTEHAPVAMPDAAQVIIGQPTVIRPLLNDIPGADPLHPTAKLALAGPAAAPAGTAVTTDVASGTLTVTAQTAGLYSVGYQDAFGSAPVAQGQILINARAPAGSAQPPVTTPAAALLRGQVATTVDVLTGDYDPSGGLLTVVSADAPLGVEVAIVSGEWLRIQATAASIGGQQIVTYQVTNGLTPPVTGQVTVTWLPPLATSPPLAPTIFATVRAGDETDVSVLQQDSDPAGNAMTLIPGSARVTPAGTGSASLNGGTLRYAAPPASAVKAVAQVDVAYIVTDTAGESTTGHVAVTVNPTDAAYDAAPVPTEVDARVTAGDTITVPIPTTGVDPAGDSVAVTGITDAAQLGRVLSVQSNSITYQAYPLSAGTDSVGYVVESRPGLTGQSRVRIAVTPPTLVPPPVAVNEQVLAAPGSVVVVDVLAGAIVAAGDIVTVEPLATTNAKVPAGAQLQGSALQLTAPTGPQPVVITYGITDGSSQPSLAQVTVRSQAGISPAPVAVDDYPGPPAAGTTVTVDVLKNDFDSTGSSQTLSIARVFDADVTIKGRGLDIPILGAPRSVPYEVKGANGTTAVGVVHLQGTVVGPRVKPGAAIQLPKAGSLTVPINNDIVDSRGPVSLISTSGVFPSPASGLAVQTLSYTTLSLSAVGDYVGPAALVVEVTDGTSPTDPKGHTAVLSIPVQVGPPTPILRCPTTPLTVIQGGSPAALSLASVCSVWTPDPTAAAALSFTATWATQPTGVSLSWKDSGNRDLIVTAASASQPGATGTITVGVTGGGASSPLPIVIAPANLATVSAVSLPGVNTGSTATVDMRQYVTSPLADAHIQALAVRQTGASSASASVSGSVVSITPQPGTHGALAFEVDVTDIPGHPDRTVTGGITLQVLDAPGAPGALEGVPGDQHVALSWGAAMANGSPVDYYQVTLDGGSPTNVPGTAYDWPGLTNGTAYQFTVQAHNQVGLSAASATASFTPKSIPGAPGAVSATPGDTQVSLAWGAASANGQPIDSYLISVNPAPASGSATATASGSSTSYTWAGLDNNVGPYTFSVTAHNAVGSSPATQSSAVYAHGAPPAPPPPAAQGALSPDQSTTTITVSWTAVPRCNDAQPCASYTVTELRNGSSIQTATATGNCPGSPSVCVTFGPITNDGSSYTYQLQDVNREGQTSPLSAPSAPAVRALGTPGAVTDLSLTQGNQSLGAKFTLPPSHGATISKVNYTASNQSGGSSTSGSWTSPGASGQTVTETIPGLANGQNYAVNVAACNEAGECGAPSNTASTFPYGPPGAPSVSASANGNTVTFSWSGGGGNGQPVKNYVVCIDGGCTSPTAAGSVSNGYGCNTSHSIYASVVDAAGQQSPNSATASATTAACAPTMSLTIGWSSNWKGWVYFDFHGFSNGSYTYSCIFTGKGAQTLGPFNISVPPTHWDNGHTCEVFGGSGQGTNVQWRINTGPGVPPGGIYSNTLS